jgi:hypothetical protein
MERAFRADFSDVRIHEGFRARALDAHAFAQGADIHFEPGGYDPHSAEGQRTLAHELVHVVQQRAQRVPSSGGAHAEHLSEAPHLLRHAKGLLEHPGPAAKVTGLIGMPVEKALDLLPAAWADVVSQATHRSLQTALHVALKTIDDRPRLRSRDALHKLRVAATGVGGGAFGLAGCP